jgi:hypothetical protein
MLLGLLCSLMTGCPGRPLRRGVQSVYIMACIGIKAPTVSLSGVQLAVKAAMMMRFACACSVDQHSRVPGVLYLLFSAQTIVYKQYCPPVWDRLLKTDLGDSLPHEFCKTSAKAEGCAPGDAQLWTNNGTYAQLLPNTNIQTGIALPSPRLFVPSSYHKCHIQSGGRLAAKG